VAAAETGARPAATPELQRLLDEGQRALSAGRWSEAVPAYEKALGLDPANEEVLFGLGTAFSQVGRDQEAARLLERLLAKAPDSAMVKNNLAWLYAKAKDPAVRNPVQTVKLARDAVLAIPSDYNLWNTLAEAHYAAGHYAQALRRAQIALQLGTLAGVTNTAPFREVVERCRAAAGASKE
jgi:Flp pilus assembly protein TadD